ncbi:DUF4136 domain-containing protein [Agarivorans sp. MS3-6]
MRLKPLPFLFVAILLAGLFGCVSSEQAGAPEKRSTTVVSGDTSYLQNSKGRYAWHPSLIKAHLKKAENEALLLSEMRKSIAKVMSEKGYIQVNANQQPDFFIGFGAALESEMSDQQILERAGLMAGMSSNDVDPALYQKGSMLVALFYSLETGPFWRVLGQGMAAKHQPLDERKLTIERGVSRMLQHIPQR